MRRATAALMVVGLGVVSHLVGVNGVATATTPPTEPTDTTTAEEQAAVESALLVLADFPADWTEEPEEEPTEQELAYQAQVAECADGTGDDLLDLGGPRARSADFVGPDDQRVEQSVTIVEPAVAEDFMARFAAPGVDLCFRDAVRTFVGENFESPADPSQSLPGDVTIGEVTVGEVLLAPAGDDLVAYRVALPLTISGVTVDSFVDVVAVRSGGSVVGLTFQSLFEPFPADDVADYVAIAVERLPG